MVEPTIEVKSAGGHILLTGSINPNAHVSVFVDNFIHVEPGSIAQEVKAVVKFIKGLSITEQVSVGLSRNQRARARSLDTAVALPILQAYRESSASDLTVYMDLGKEEHHNVITHGDCKDTITTLLVFDYQGPFQQKHKDDFESLSKLSSLCLCQRYFNFPEGWNQFFSLLTNVSFSKTLKDFYTDIRNPDDAKSTVELLKKNPQIKLLTICRSSDSQAHSLLLNALLRDSGVNLKSFDMTIPDAALVSEPFIAALEMVILNLSPQLRSLTLKLSIDDNTKDQLKPRLFSAMKQNTSPLALKKFLFEVSPNVDLELRQQCSAFAAKKKISRATSGMNRLPPGALPLALNAHMDPLQSSSYFLYEALRSNNELQDLIGNMVDKNKSRKRKQNPKDSTANMKATVKHPKN